tara:strand:+ start:9069 stop:9992 length:924 start_codon:yes stop_codon:yes gene_type:complete
METKIIQYLPLTHTRATFKLITRLNHFGIDVILDLEDSVQDPFSMDATSKIKESSRLSMLEFIDSDRFKKLTLSRKPFIRINGISTKYFDADIEMINQLAKKGFFFGGIFFPKTETREEIDKLISAINYQTDIIPMIETVRGDSNAHSIVDHPKVDSFHYGHFDYALDSKQWPFLDPDHMEFWTKVDNYILLGKKLNKTFIHTPFPFTKNPKLFWETIRFMNSRYNYSKIIICTLNAELSLSKPNKKISDLKFRKYEQKTESSIKLAEMIIDDYESGRANKRSFGISNNRFIPPHQYFAAKRFLEKG